MSENRYQNWSGFPAPKEDTVHRNAWEIFSSNPEDPSSASSNPDTSQQPASPRDNASTDTPGSAQNNTVRQQGTTTGTQNNTVSQQGTTGGTQKSRSQNSRKPGNQNSHRSGPGKKRTNRKAMRRRQVRRRLFLLFVIAAILTAVIVYLIIRFSPTTRRMSYEEYFGTLKKNEAAIILQDQILTDQRAFVSEAGAVYLPHTLVRDSLNERFFWDEEGAQVLFTTATQTFEIPVGTASYTVINGALPTDPAQKASYVEPILLQPGTTGSAGSRDSQDTGSTAPNGTAPSLYLSLSFLAQYTDIASVYDPDTRHVFIQTKWGQTQTSNARKEAAVRFENSIKSPIVADLLQGEQVTVLEQETDWLKVQTKDGFIGWAKANRMSTPETTDLKNEGFTPIEYPSITMDEKVALVWHMITYQDDNKSIQTATEGMTGINVISPTWFSLADNEGNVDSRGSTAYVENAHNKGLKVWGLVDDFSPDMDNSVMLASTKARRNCISQLINYAKTLGIDGINIDFEHIDPGDAYTYTEFIREISIACRLNSLVLSVDTYPPYEFNAHLNRPEIAAVCDYLINMGYDEHYVGSETAGSVASLGYEEGAINNLLLMGVPAHKLISAIPFYTRIWYTSQDEAGTTYINSEELSMRAVKGTLDSWNLTPTWDPVTAQNYVAWYTDDGVLCEIWIEDAASLQRKALLVSANGLAGCAIWALGFQDNTVWDTISETLALSRDDAAALTKQLQEQDNQKALENIQAQQATESDPGPQAAA